MGAAAIDLPPSPLPRLQRARGVGRVVVTAGHRGTALDTLYQEGCAKIRLPNTHDRSLQAVLINTAGGLTGGDDLNWQAEAGPGSALVLTTPACERVYRSTGPDALVETRLRVAAGARLDWLPQETILFQGSKLRRRIEVDLEGDARFLAVEAVLLGREAMGEEARDACLSDRWRVRRNGRLLHAETTRLTGTALERDGVSLLGGARAFATLLYIGPDAGRHLDPVRHFLRERAGASLVGERLVVRVLAESGLALRRVIAPIIATLAGAGALPRLWYL